MRLPVNLGWSQTGSYNQTTFRPQKSAYQKLIQQKNRNYDRIGRLISAAYLFLFAEKQKKVLLLPQ